MKWLTRSAVGMTLSAVTFLAGCSCAECRTEPPPIVHMARAHAEADRNLAYLAGRGSELLDLAQRTHAGDAPPDALREVRRDAVALHLRLVEWRLGSNQLFQGMPFMTLPAVRPPVAQPGETDDVQLLDSDADRYYAALQEALPLMIDKCDQIESDLAALLGDPAESQN